MTAGPPGAGGAPSRASASGAASDPCPELAHGHVARKTGHHPENPHQNTLARNVPSGLIHAHLARLGTPRGFANRDLRPILAQLPGVPAGSVTPGKMTYDLRRPRRRGLIERIPHTFRYQVTDTGLARALFLTRLHDRFLRTGLASLAGPADGSRDLAAATRAYTTAVNDLTRQAGLAA